MLGAIIGDIVGSRFEFNNYRHKDFDFFTDQCVLTDDSIMLVLLDLQHIVWTKQSFFLN